MEQTEHFIPPKSCGGRGKLPPPPSHHYISEHIMTIASLGRGGMQLPPLAPFLNIAQDFSEGICLKYGIILVPFWHQSYVQVKKNILSDMLLTNHQ